jgi:hypothetical protein
MKNGKQFIFALAALCAILSDCAGSPPPPPPPVSAQSASKSDELDAAIRETSDYLNKQLTKGNKLMILNVQSDFPAMSEYIIDELIANTVNDRVFSVVDRQQLDTIRAELDFQMSGEVDDKTAQALGRMAGAQIIISGAVSKIGDLYRLRVRALSVQSAQIEGQFNKNIPDSPIVTALVNSKATGYGGTAMASGGNRTPASLSTAVPPSQAPVNSQPVANTNNSNALPKRGTVYSGNGHSYEVFNQTISWTGAKRYCEELGGHLATVTSSEEQTFIENLLARGGNKRFYWVGGYCGNDRRFQWVTGEPFVYANWMRGEPNNNEGREDKMQIIRIPPSNVNNSKLGQWNDASNNSDIMGSYEGDLGFICEWD